MDINNFFNDYGYETGNLWTGRNKQLNEQGMPTEACLDYGKGFYPCGNENVNPEPEPQPEPQGLPENLYIVSYGNYTWTDGTGTTYNQSGDYTYDYEEDGVSKRSTLHLFITDQSTEDGGVCVLSTTDVQYETVCEEYEWHHGDGTSEIITESGVHAYNYMGENGLTIQEQLRLTVNHGDNSVETVEACDSYTWEDGDGETYTQSGVYTYDYTNIYGCPSVATLHLTITHDC